MKIGDRGQVTIPKMIREKYGLLPQVEVEFVKDEGGLLIRKKTSQASPIEKVYGILKKYESTDQYMEEIRGR